MPLCLGLPRHSGYGAPQAKLDILAFDACDLATVEMACQLEPFAKYLLGSQIGSHFQAGLTTVS